MKIIEAHDAGNQPELGPKAQRLAELRILGYQVPAFVVIPQSVCAKILLAKTTEQLRIADEVALDVASVLPRPLYAVRSAGLSEDDLVTSQAGKFSTKLAISFENLSEAVLAVLNDAARKLTGDQCAFSIIIQEYLEPQQSGVVFTSAPTGEAELVLEYVSGIATSAVGGDAVTTLRTPRVQRQKSHGTNEWTELINTAYLIETHYGYPQDIEWVKNNGKFYIVQTRPVTSLRASQWAGIQYLDTLAFGINDYLFEKDTLSETCARPRPLTFSLLQALYASDGPVSLAYDKIGVRYLPTGQLRVIGNELFIDREAEIATLFPTHSYVRHKQIKPHFVRWRGYWQSLKNTYRLARLRTEHLHHVTDELAKILRSGPEPENMTKAWQYFTSCYWAIFLTNLAAQKALVTLRSVAPTAPVDLLTEYVPDRKVLENLVSDLVNQPVGNSISFDDQSHFMIPEQRVSMSSRREVYLAIIPVWKRPLIVRAMNEAQYWLYWREIGRWATVRLLAELRKVISRTADTLQVEPELVQFATINEVMSNDVSVLRCKARQREFGRGNTLELPQRIASYALTQDTNKDFCGISSGVASGRLVTADQLSTAIGDTILYTNVLSPDLTKYFGRIKGIVSERGGLLSHLAIVAREQQLPVVVNKTVHRETIGKVVVIDGSKGTCVVECN